MKKRKKEAKRIADKKEHKKISNKKVVHKRRKRRINYITQEEIDNSLKDLKTNEEQFNYYEKLLRKPGYLKERTKKRAFKILGDFYVMKGKEKEAGRAFRNAGDYKDAKECYQTDSFFTEQDKETLKNAEVELKNLKKDWDKL